MARWSQLFLGNECLTEMTELLAEVKEHLSIWDNLQNSKRQNSVIDLTDLLLDFFEVWLFLTMWGKKNKMVIPARFSHNYCAMQCFSTFLCELDKNQLFIQHELHSYYPNLLTQANMEQIIISFKTLSLEVNSYHGFIEDTSST